MKENTSKRIKLIVLLLVVGSLDVYFFGKAWPYLFVYLFIYYFFVFWFRGIKWAINEHKEVKNDMAKNKN